MKRALVVGLLLIAAIAAPPLAHQVHKSQVAHMSLRVGDHAPDFTLLTNEWKTVKLSDYCCKKNVFLAVYVLAFSEGCTKQMRAVQAGIDSGRIPTSDTEVFGVSLDSPAANAAASKTKTTSGLFAPTLSSAGKASSASSTKAISRRPQHCTHPLHHAPQAAPHRLT